MITKELDKEARKARAKKLKHYSYSNLALLGSSSLIPISDIPNWLNAIRQARMLDDIQAIWITTEVIIKQRDPNAETAASKDRYQEGLKTIIALSMSGRTSSAGGARAVQP